MQLKSNLHRNKSAPLPVEKNVDFFCFDDRYWTMDRSLQRRLQKTNYQHIKRLCRDRGQLFEDADFPANNKSLSKAKKPNVHPIVWLRPHVSSMYFLGLPIKNPVVSVILWYSHVPEHSQVPKLFALYRGNLYRAFCNETLFK